MEPVTHVLTGACLARSGLNRRTAYATAAMAIAAEFPDIDTLWGVRGPVASFEHHRGITHTFLAVPVEAGLLLGLFYLFHAARSRRAARSADSRPARASHKALPIAPRWPTLYLCLVVALLSHLLLDFTNNYGVRPFFPFVDRWYAASIVFIFDPLLFLFLVTGLLLPVLLALVGQEVSGRKHVARGVGWPRVALFAVAMLWAVRLYEHKQAVVLADQQSLLASPAPPSDSAAPSPEAISAVAGPEDLNAATEVLRSTLSARSSLASPDPLSIFKWYTVSDFGPAFRLGVADTAAGSLAPGRILQKPLPSRTLTAAQQSHLGRVYLDWSPMPWISLPARGEAFGDNSPATEVLFEDPRFMGDTAILHRGSTPPITGYVLVGRGGAVLEQGLDGKPGR